MQQRVIKKLSVLAVLIVSLCLAAVVTPLQQASATSTTKTTKCVNREFGTWSKKDVCVTYIQKMLNINNGAYLKADGVYGPKTKAQVIIYQTQQRTIKKDMLVDGIVGVPQTWPQLCASQEKYPSIAKSAGCTMKPATTPTSATINPVAVALTKNRDARHGCDAKTYSNGSKGACVKYLQQLFNTLQPTPRLAEDGVYGPKTETIVKAWQATFKIKSDTAGTMDSKTWDSVCFWNGKRPDGTAVPATLFTAWTKAAKKVGCTA